jgi:hypothetical protein
MPSTGDTDQYCFQIINTQRSFVVYQCARAERPPLCRAMTRRRPRATARTTP